MQLDVHRFVVRQTRPKAIDPKLGLLCICTKEIIPKLGWREFGQAWLSPSHFLSPKIFNSMIPSHFSSPKFFNRIN